MGTVAHIGRKQNKQQRDVRRVIEGKEKEKKEMEKEKTWEHVKGFRKESQWEFQRVFAWKKKGVLKKIK